LVFYYLNDRFSRILVPRVRGFAAAEQKGRPDHEERGANLA
jgi:hypothetical protein